MNIRETIRLLESGVPIADLAERFVKYARPKFHGMTGNLGTPPVAIYVNPTPQELNAIDKEVRDNPDLFQRWLRGNLLRDGTIIVYHNSMLHDWGKEEAGFGKRWALNFDWGPGKTRMTAHFHKEKELDEPSTLKEVETLIKKHAAKLRSTFGVSKVVVVEYVGSAGEKAAEIAL